MNQSIKLKSTTRGIALDKSYKLSADNFHAALQAQEIIHTALVEEYAINKLHQNKMIEIDHILEARRDQKELLDTYYHEGFEL
jgi:hypothetical protein